MQIYFNPTGLTDFSEATKEQLQKALPFANFTFAPNTNYNAEIIIGYPSIVKRENFDEYPRLKAIHLLSTGYDELDLNHLKSRNIRLINARATTSVAISELVLGQILNFNYNLTVYHKLQDQKIWRRYFTSIELQGANALILGAGVIGQSIAKRLKVMGVNVEGYRRRNIKTPHFSKIYTDLAEVKALIPNYDYIIVALPLSKATTNLIDMSWFEKMDKNALFINIARGEIVVEEHLNEALKKDLIRGAILDVTKKEPLPIDSPLWERDNLRLTPHISFYSNRFLDNIISLIITNLEHYHKGQSVETEVKL
ncbi:MAG: D-2-hydroxyacid dehydrogenase [Bacilli bacterium]